jgi:hypothetical protein
MNGKLGRVLKDLAVEYVGVISEFAVGTDRNYENPQSG